MTSKYTKFGVYRFTNTVNGRYYYGITSKGFLKRWRSHFRKNKNGEGFQHRANPEIDADVRKYGIESFLFEIIEQFDSEDGLKEREMYYLKMSANDPLCYNMSPHNLFGWRYDWMKPKRISKLEEWRNAVFGGEYEKYRESRKTARKIGIVKVWMEEK